MKLSTKFKIATNTIPVVSVIIANCLGELNLGYVIGAITWAITTALITLSFEADKIEKKWRIK